MWTHPDEIPNNNLDDDGNWLCQPIGLGQQKYFSKISGKWRRKPYLLESFISGLP